MGGIGSDIAVDAADIALVNDEIRELPHLLGLAKRMMRVSKGNLTISKLQQGDHVRVVTASGLTLIDTHTHHGSLQLNAGATTGMVIVQIEREGKTYTTKAVLR